MDWSFMFIVATFIVCNFQNGHAQQYSRNQQQYNNQRHPNQNYPNQQLRGQQKPTRNVVVNSVGFIGGPDSNRDGPIRKMWLLFRRFVAYTEVKRNGYSNLLILRNDIQELSDNAVSCKSGCPSGSYCDKGICRCKRKLMALHGTCWKHHEGVIEDAANWELKKQQNLTTNPLEKYCRADSTCKQFDINMLCSLTANKCRCRINMGMRWNPEEAECQVFVPVICEKIVNGTVVEEEEEENKETEEEKVEELDQLANQQKQLNRFESQQTNGYTQYGSSNPYGNSNQYNQYGKKLSNQMNDVKKKRFGSDTINDEESDDEDEEPKADMLFKLKPNNYNVDQGQIKNAFCHDLTLLYKNYTIEKEGGEYFFAPFKSTPLIAAIFIILSIIIAGGCFFAFAHTGKTESFFKSKFKTPKRVDTNPDFHDVDDSDDEKMVGATPSRAPNNRNVKLFSTPEHNPNNPFNATPERKHPKPPVHYK